MIVTCEACGQAFDDEFCLTYCPHESFEMRTATRGADGKTRFARKVEELFSPISRPQTPEEEQYDQLLKEIFREATRD